MSTHLRAAALGAALNAALGAATAAGLLGAAGPALADNTGELVDRSQLRVCADPSHLPLSNDKGEGFENKIAEALAAKLGVPLAYTWYPNSVGMVRNTLRADLCDLLIGVVAADELVQNTNPYYRSAYVLVRRAADAARFPSLDAPDTMTARVGVIAGTPPATLLARRNLVAQAVPYHLVVDTRAEDPSKTMIDDLAAGRLDIALLWGPIAGWLVRQSPTPLQVEPLVGDPREGLRMDYRISMGLRQGEPLWKRDLNNQLRALKPTIDKILADYAVPLLDERGRLINAALAPADPAGAAGPADSVPEPAGYRTDRYRAPVPATLGGATVLDTPALRALIDREHPLLLDVLPMQREPPNRAPEQVWMPPKRQHIPGSVWLANVGYGELPPDFRKYFADELARLSGGDRAKPMVFYCDTNCWMSWNAAKRAMAELGYSRVYWYPAGTGGWQAAGLPLEEATPPRQPGFQG